MWAEIPLQERTSAEAGRAAGARIIKPLQSAQGPVDDQTAQMAGLRRLAVISHGLVGSEKLWAGVLLAEPRTASSVHHHGPLETVAYVLSGQSKVRWGSRLEYEADLEPGDFLLIPPYLPHQEINPSPDRPTQWVVVRSGQEAIVVNLTRGPGGEYVEEDTGEGKPPA
jgi:uncharacterized RmlC-like cupin family protein